MQNHAGTKKHVQEDKRNKGGLDRVARVSKVALVNGNSPGRILLLLLASRHLLGGSKPQTSVAQVPALLGNDSRFWFLDLCMYGTGTEMVLVYILKLELEVLCENLADCVSVLKRAPY